VELPDRPLSDGVIGLAPAGPDDAADVAAAVPPGEPGAWEPTPGPYTPAQARRILDRWERGRRRGSRAALTVRAAGDGRFLGAIVVMAGTPERPLDATARAALEIAWWVAPTARGAGVATRAATLVADWARHTPAVELLWAEIDPANVVSRRVALAAGFAAGERLERERGTVDVFRMVTAA